MAQNTFDFSHFWSNLKTILSGKANTSDLGAAAAKGVDSSPTASSVNLVESGGVEAALAGKQATLTTAQQAAADSGITSAKVAQYDKDSAATAELVDCGAKNHLSVGTLSSDTSTYYVIKDISPIAAGDYVYSAKVTSVTASTNPTSRITFFDSNNVSVGQVNITRNSGVIEHGSITLTGTAVKAQFNPGANNSVEAESFEIENPMICTAADWAVSQQFVPYCPTMAEMYDMIKALQT